MPDTDDPFPWMCEVMDLKKEVTSSETRVIDYQTGGGLAWDRTSGDLKAGLDGPNAGQG